MKRIEDGGLCFGGMRSRPRTSEIPRQRYVRSFASGV